jgi:hypothetical protein
VRILNIARTAFVFDGMEKGWGCCDLPLVVANRLLDETGSLVVSLRLTQRTLGLGLGLGLGYDHRVGFNEATAMLGTHTLAVLAEHIAPHGLLAETQMSAVVALVVGRHCRCV